MDEEDKAEVENDIDVEALLKNIAQRLDIEEQQQNDEAQTNIQDNQIDNLQQIIKDNLNLDDQNVNLNLNQEQNYNKQTAESAAIYANNAQENQFLDNKQEQYLQQTISPQEIFSGASEESQNSGRSKQSQSPNSQSKSNKISNRSEEKQNQIYIVNQQADQNEEIDPILKTMEKIEIQTNILGNPEIEQYELSTSPIATLVDAIKQQYDQNLVRLLGNQKIINQQIVGIKEKSYLQLQRLNLKEKPFLKKKFSDIQSKFKEVKILEQETQKVKYYLLMMIQRLEHIEYDLDHLIDKNLKKQHPQQLQQTVADQNQQQQQQSFNQKDLQDEDKKE